MYICARCGKNEVFDDTAYCGSCEGKYRKERHERLKFEYKDFRNRISKHGDDCDCGGHTITFEEFCRTEP